MECRLLPSRLIEDLDQTLADAVREIEDTDAEKIVITMKFTVGQDELGEPLILAAHTDSTTKKTTEIRPGGSGQLRLPQDRGIESVTFEGMGHSVTLGKK